MIEVKKSDQLEWQREQAGTARSAMKNTQVIDRAENCVYDIFAARDDVFDLVFAPGTDVAFAEDLEMRPDANRVSEALATIWTNRVPKAQVRGIHGTLFYGLSVKRKYYPTLRDEEAINPDGSGLIASSSRSVG